MLCPSNQNVKILEKIAQSFFWEKRSLALVIDDTLLKKIYSRFIRGTGRFYDTGLGRCIQAYKLLCCGVTDGKYFFPLMCNFLFDKSLLTTKMPSKAFLVQQMIQNGLNVFRGKELTILADGAFATIQLFLWCIKHNIRLTTRMHSNRKVYYKGKPLVIRDIKKLNPNGRRMACAIKAYWHGMELYISSERRINKNREESVVYLALTYQGKPSSYVKAYKKRWPIEKFFRTAKQHLGLQDCFSTKMDVQMNHITSTFVAYAFAVLEQRKQKVATPEETIRRLKRKKVKTLIQRYLLARQIFGVPHA